ncbi:MAG: hypothetical protein B7Z78_07770 [Rhodospirillales bacterium 20-60-12]|nr:MAG: hypothetical protein B7Z78_07770 [Rhodospirillales bacterium 20-60-12]HQT67277.1 hypothetical protein [Acetobacteraceae bacterium]
MASSSEGSGLRARVGLGPAMTAFLRGVPGAAGSDSAATGAFRGARLRGSGAAGGFERLGGRAMARLL